MCVCDSLAMRCDALSKHESNESTLDAHLFRSQWLDLETVKSTRPAGRSIFAATDLSTTHEDRCFYVSSGLRHKSSESLLRDMRE